MKQTVTEDMFIDTLNKLRPNQFSYYALCALFEHYEALEEDTGEQIEFDPIAICCEWTEYGLADEAAEAYGLDVSKSDEEIIEELREKYTVIETEDEGLLVSEG